MLLQCLALTSLKSREVGGVTAVFGSVTSLKSGEVGGVTAVFGSVTSLLNLERVGCYCSVWLCD